jgi:type I restriction enzyme S subunit
VIPTESRQSEIVATLDISSEIQHRAAAHLMTARRVIARFRRSVLAAACCGRLTADWRRAHLQDAIVDHEALTRVAAPTTKLRRGVNPDAPTDELIEALQLPVTWSVKTTSRLLAEGILQDVKDGNHGAVHPTAKEFSAEGVPFIAANCVKNGHIDYERAQKLSPSVVARLRVGFAEPGDVVLTHKGSVGRVAINTRPCILTPQTTYYRTDRSALLAEYLALYLQSTLFSRQLDAVKSQTTRDFVPISEQYLLSIVVPPVSEQREIVELAAQKLTALELLLDRIGNAGKSVDRIANSVSAHVLRAEPAKSGPTP